MYEDSYPTISTTQSSYYMGCDLGQAADYSTIVIMQSLEVSAAGANDQPSQKYYIRHCERLPLGTSYNDVVTKVVAYVEQFRQKGVHIALIVDQTGVGRPIVDSFRAAGLKPVGVNVTGGTNTNYDKGTRNVPKRDLVASAKVLLGKEQLKIGEEIQFKDTLIKELQNFHVKVNLATGHDSYEAWREGVHDDFVFAVSLVCWYALKQEKSGGRAILLIEITKGDYYDAPHLTSAFRGSGGSRGITKGMHNYR
jgi:hypothetical protein